MHIPVSVYITSVIGIIVMIVVSLRGLVVVSATAVVIYFLLQTDMVHDPKKKSPPSALKTPIQKETHPVSTDAGYGGYGGYGVVAKMSAKRSTMKGRTHADTPEHSGLKPETIRADPLYETHLDHAHYDQRMSRGVEADWKRHFEKGRDIAQEAASDDLEQNGRKDPNVLPMDGHPLCKRNLSQWTAI
jgi:hypothetical protein